MSLNENMESSLVSDLRKSESLKNYKPSTIKKALIKVSTFKIKPAFYQLNYSNVYSSNCMIICSFIFTALMVGTAGILIGNFGDVHSIN